MHRTSPPPPLDSQVDDLGDRLIVTLRPRRSRRAVLFHSVWLIPWAFGLIDAIRQLANGVWAMAIWLVAWLSAGFFAIATVAWRVGGRSVLTVTPSNLQIVRGIGRFVRTRTYYADLVEWIAVGKTDGRYCVRISYRGVDVDFGAGMSKQEATEIAAAALARIRPQSWWSASEDPPASITADEEPAESKSSARVGRKALLPVGVIAALAWLAVETLKPTPKRAQVTSAPYLRPDPRYLSTPRLYAIAMTSWALTSGHSALIGRPSCDANATWKHWSCRARATTATGVVVAYRCESDSASTGGMTCWVLKPQSPIAQEP